MSEFDRLLRDAFEAGYRNADQPECYPDFDEWRAALPERTWEKERT